MKKDPTTAQLEARQFFLHPYRTTLLGVAKLAVLAFDEWQERWENAVAALHAIGVEFDDEQQELELALVSMQNERDAS